MRLQKDTIKDKYLGIIGCGNMGQAIIKGILAKGIIARSHIIVSDKRVSSRSYIRRKYGLKGQNNKALAKKCDILILAVKPQDLSAVMNEISALLSSKKLLISILAGVKTDQIRHLSEKNSQIVRVMPNIGALVGESISAISFTRNTKQANRRIVMKIFSSLGETIEVNESQMDAITAVSGSGPAYFFYLVEALTESAIGLGLSKKVAGRLAVKTAIGSAKLLQELREEPKVLRKKITSKKGTTEAALKVFNKRNLKKIIKEATIAAAKRSRQLSREK